MGRKTKNTEQAMLDFYLQDAYFQRVLALGCSVVQTENAQTPPAFIQRLLFLHGRVVYIPDNTQGIPGGYYRGVPEGLPDRFGRYRSFTLFTENGLSLGVHKGYEIRANVNAIPPLLRIWPRCELMSKIDKAIKRNLSASVAPWIIGATKEQKQEIEAALQAVEDGLPAIVGVEVYNALATQDISQQYICDRLHDLRAAVWAEMLKDVGIVAASNYKRERVQTAEVNASAGESIDSIYIMIDQVNADAEYYGAPLRLKYNGFAAAFDQTEEGEVNGNSGII
jgi:hypothetical protein